MRLVGILLVNGCDLKRSGFGSFAVVLLDYVVMLSGFLMASPTFSYSETISPLTFYGVENVLLFPCRVKLGGEAVFLARDPAFTGVIDFRNVAGGRRNVG